MFRSISVILSLGCPQSVADAYMSLHFTKHYNETTKQKGTRIGKLC